MNELDYPDKISILSSRVTEDVCVFEGDVSSDFLSDCIEPDRFSVISPVHYRFQCERSGRGILVRGIVRVGLSCYCDRCLSPFELELPEVDICIFREGLEDREIDLTEDIREDIVLSLPARLLCDEDCQGLCPQCGVNLNSSRCDCIQDKPVNSPWDQLNGLNL